MAPRTARDVHIVLRAQQLGCETAVLRDASNKDKRKQPTIKYRVNQIGNQHKSNNSSNKYEYEYTGGAVFALHAHSTKDSSTSWTVCALGAQHVN